MAKIGAFVLETLTTGMYLNQLDAIREFVQNSTDSIRKAESTGILKNGEGRIEIIIEPNKNKVTIRDNGSGIPSLECFDRLVDIGMSTKDIENDAGFRGIGRLAGMAYCKQLSFRTSTLNEKEISIISFDCEGIRKSISPNVKQVEELTSVMAKFSNKKTESCKEGDHFFEVILEDLTEVGKLFLNWKVLEDYLCQVAPIGFDAQRFPFATEITKWLKNNEINIPIVTLIIKTPEMERQVFKPYKTKYKTKRDNYHFDIKNIRFYPETVSKESPFWIWYGETDLLGAIDDQRVAGLRFRKYNIDLGGPDRVAELFAQTAESNRRFNAYYIGEIHVLSKEVIPNARRDGFEDNGAWPKIKTELMTFIKARNEEIRFYSDDRNRKPGKILASANSLINDVEARLKNGIGSHEEREELLNRVKKETERINRSLESKREEHELKHILPVSKKLKDIKNTLEDNDNFPRFKPNLDRKQRQVIIDILDILYNTLDKNNYLFAKKAILSKYQLEEREVSNE